MTVNASDAWIDVSVLPPFVAAVLVLLLAPGPDMAFMVATGLRDGRTGAARAAVGITAGVSVYVVLTALGLGAFLATAPGVIDTIQLIGAAYLAYLAWTTWRSSGEPLEVTTAQHTGVFRRGFIVNISNPKIMLFFTAFLPQFLGEATGNPVLQLLMLGLLLQILGLAVDLAIGFAAGTFRTRVLERDNVRKLLERFAATVYGALAAVLIADTTR
ncbi:threonine/homoserine/homoserine lactone efflux protein [Saccharopolyspora dendranthemae]|uniref:Threonine/homoserine/homoserine lactone efflux protein n=1 Tax=Saccharopolyspora dendranthemae TaxID=1181886 RepID=A0A561U5R2_9PSEU|nr:threonine/homoserine/homoserine lactone efflux protein [Saccharopolyspora dendranthemae]